MTFLQVLKSFYKANIDHYNTLKEQSSASHLIDLDANELYQTVHSESTPVFILSTGRCGTKLLTKILSEIKKLDVHHQPYPEFSWHGKYAYEQFDVHPEKLKLIFDAARYEMIRDTFLNKKVFVETNNRITFFAHQIAELYPNARFIHLIREPVSFVKSGLARNWYSGKELYDEGRIIDHNNPQEWAKYTAEEKIAWLWRTTNEFVNDFKKGCNVLTVRSKDLFTDPDIANKILNFIDQESISVDHLKKILSQPVNKTKKNILLTEEQIERIDDITSNYFKQT